MDRITIREYNLLIEAFNLRQVDTDYRIHELAYLNYVASREKKSGKNKVKPVFSTFEKFFDYEKEVNKVSNRYKKKSRFSGIGKLLKRGD